MKRRVRRFTPANKVEILRLFFELVEEGHKQTKAYELVGVSGKNLIPWVRNAVTDKSYPSWIGEKWHQHFGSCCALCSKRFITLGDAQVAKEEIYEGVSIKLYFCSIDCGQKWEEQDD